VSQSVRGTQAASAQRAIRGGVSLGPGSDDGEISATKPATKLAATKLAPDQTGYLAPEYVWEQRFLAQERLAVPSNLVGTSSHSASHFSVHLRSSPHVTHSYLPPQLRHGPQISHRRQAQVRAASFLTTQTCVHTAARVTV